MSLFLGSGCPKPSTHVVMFGLLYASRYLRDWGKHRFEI